jgi:hypothetical protein
MTLFFTKIAIFAANNIRPILLHPHSFSEYSLSILSIDRFKRKLSHTYIIVYLVGMQHFRRNKSTYMKSLPSAGPKVCNDLGVSLQLHPKDDWWSIGLRL